MEDEDSDDLEPAEGDLTSTDGVHFDRGGRCVLTIQVREPPRSIGERGTRTRDADVDEVSPTATWAQIERFLRRKRLSINVWQIDVDGDYHLMRKPARRRKQSPLARARLILAVTAAERKYGQDREQWPGHVQRQIQRLAERR